MKKFYILLAAIPFIFFATGCDDNQTDYEPARSVEIVSADLEYQPAGGSGTIVANVNGTIQASSSVDWCTVSASGRTVNVTVSPYDGLDNRYAKIEIKSGNAASYVTLHQYGTYFDLSYADDYYHIDDINGKVEIPLTHYNHFPESTADVDWLTTEFREGFVTIKAADNTTGIPRSGNITIGNKTMTIEQWSFDTTFAGEYEWRGTTALGGSTYGSMKITIKDFDPESETCSVKFNDIDSCEISAQFIPETYTLRIHSGRYAGTKIYKSKQVYLFSMVYVEGSVSWGANYYVDFPLELNQNGKWTGTLTDRGSYAGKTITAVFFELFSAPTASSANRLSVRTGPRYFNNTITKL